MQCTKSVLILECHARRVIVDPESGHWCPYQRHSTGNALKWLLYACIMRWTPTTRCGGVPSSPIALFDIITSCLWLARICFIYTQMPAVRKDPPMVCNTRPTRFLLSDLLISLCILLVTTLIFTRPKMTSVLRLLTRVCSLVCKTWPSMRLCRLTSQVFTKYDTPLG